jgi:hypothetical protein
MSSTERQLGVDLFNGTWRLIESREDDNLMIDCAHASAYHWAQAPECGPENLARSAWLLSRVYTLVDQPEQALRYAQRCLALCEANDLEDWDLAFAYEALARASKSAGDPDAAAQFVSLARGVPVRDAEDRDAVDSDLATI